MLADAMDSPTGPPADGDSIHTLLHFLWWGDRFNRTADDAFQRAGDRLQRNIEWIQQIRENYAPSRVAKPVSRQYKFEHDEVTEMHNKYMNSLDWMPPDVRDKYEQLRLEDRKSVV